MATIFYSMSGEGRGHASRVRAIVEELRQRHRVVLYAPGHAWDFLAPAYKGTEVEVRHIEGLSFYYRLDGRLDEVRTLVEGVKKYLGFPGRIESIKKDMRLERPDLVITDFDALLPRAAEQLNIPYMSINHQHFLLTYDLSELPVPLRLRAMALAAGVRCFYGSQIMSVVSSFYFPPLRPGVSGVRQVGVLLGPEIRELAKSVRDDGFVLAYLRRSAPLRVLRALKRCGLPVKVYGLGYREPKDNLEFCPVDAKQFPLDLSRCRALVCTAGNQLVGEALYFGKPVLAMPEPGNDEQEINGFFLQWSGAGRNLPMHTLDGPKLRAFLANLNSYKSPIPRERLCANGEVAKIIEEVLQSHCPWHRVRSAQNTVLEALGA